jgi:hypothetical protein
VRRAAGSSNCSGVDVAEARVAAVVMLTAVDGLNWAAWRRRLGLGGSSEDSSYWARRRRQLACGRHRGGRDFWAREKSMAEDTPTAASRLGGVGVIQWEHT